jgi:NADPH:quinone reductase
MGGTAYAEYISKPWIKVLPVPSEVSARTAAASLVSGLTALTFIEEAYRANEGDYVLVHAAAGGLGLNLCQLLRAKGVHVIGSVSSEQKAQLAKENGAEFVVIYTKEDLIKRVAEITDGQGVQGIYDGVGKATCVHYSLH